tara:strand:- start:287 stop:553 length:267 start_codon:yes stop_codon:yes gene_type:complete
MLIDNTNDKVASEEEKAIWKILDNYKLNPMLQPNCADEIIELVNKLFIQRVSNRRELLLAYHRYLTEELSLDLNEIWVDEYLKANNCG